jgi:hypothetical protein
MQLIKFKNKLTNGQMQEGRTENGGSSMIYLTKHSKMDVKEKITYG